MRVVVLEREILIGEAINLRHVGIEFHRGQGAGLSAQLEFCLFYVIFVEVEITEGVDEFSCLVSAYLSCHHQQHGVAGNVERYAEEQVTAALIELQAEPMLLSLLLCRNNTELEKTVAWGQRHVINLCNIPCGDNVAAAPRIVLQSVNQFSDLVDATALTIRPLAPLATIDGAEVAVLICPFIPNGYAVVLQVFDVGATFEEPQQLMNDGAQMQLFSGKAGEALAEVKTGLTTEHADGAGAGAVISAHTVGQHVIQQLKILFHDLIRGKVPREFAGRIFQHAVQW